MAGRAAAGRDARQRHETARAVRAATHSAAERSSAGNRPHAKALHRRQAGAARLRLHATRLSHRTARIVGEAPEGNRKDVRNAVEAAHAAAGKWARTTGHNRAQILYYIAENLSARAGEFADAHRRDDRMSARSARDVEVEASISRLFTYAAWADKYDGAVHSVPIRGVAIAMNEPIGVMGLACPDELPLLGLISLVGAGDRRRATRRSSFRRSRTRWPRRISIACSKPPTCRPA